MPSGLGQSSVAGIDYDSIALRAGQVTADAIFVLEQKLAQEALLRVQGDQRGVTATIAVGAEVANQRAVTVQFKSTAGYDLNYRVSALVMVLADANGDAFVATGGSTGIAVGTDGALLTLVAKKLFLAISEADGDLDLTWTDTGTEAAYLGILLPNGSLVIGPAMTNT